MSKFPVDAPIRKVVKTSELRQIQLIPVLLTFSLRNALQSAVVRQQFKLQRSHHWP